MKLTKKMISVLLMTAVSESGDYSILWARRKTDWQAQKSSNPADTAITYGSNPPSDDYITVPASYESGYSSSKYNLVTSGQTLYFFRI